MTFWTFVAATARLLRTLTGAAKLRVQRLFAQLARRAPLAEQLCALDYISNV